MKKLILLALLFSTQSFATEFMIDDDDELIKKEIITETQSCAKKETCKNLDEKKCKKDGKQTRDKEILTFKDLKGKEFSKSNYGFWSVCK